jgi:hypothetical protein
MDYVPLLLDLINNPVLGKHLATPKELTIKSAT